jgi:microcystin degradation protein MlrC
MARIAVAGFRHETNTFAPAKASLTDFENGYSWPALTRGPAVAEVVKGYNLALAGFIEAAEAAGHEIVPLLWASASPSSYVEERAYERIVGMLFDSLQAAAPVDAIFLSLHGAMVTEHLEDAEADTIKRVRDALSPLGWRIPVVVTLDYHANISPAMVGRASALLGYRTYPHEDMAATGARMLPWLERLLKGEDLSQRAFRQIPFLFPLVWGCTTHLPASRIVSMIAGLEREHDVLLTFAGGFPAADIYDCGPSVVAYGADKAACQAAVDALADAVIAAEAEFTGALLGPEEAVAKALAHSGPGPVVIADVQDNPGAGGTADTMGLLKALVAADAPGSVCGMIFDPHVASLASRSGEGTEITAALGGKHGVEGDSPLTATFLVEKVGDGLVDCDGPLYKGAHMDLAPMVLLRLGNVQIVVCSKKVQAADLAFFRHLGVEPTEARVLALKSSVHFRGAFDPIAAETILCAAPGAMVMDLKALEFTRLRPGVRM